MSEQMNDGGPAFPKTGSYHDGSTAEYDSRDESGMSLRDWLAGQALVSPYTHSESSPDRIAEWAYQIADAMLLARSPSTREGE
jgi:hypothetical protein